MREEMAIDNKVEQEVIDTIIYTVTVTTIPLLSRLLHYW